MKAARTSTYGRMAIAENGENERRECICLFQYTKLQLSLARDYPEYEPNAYIRYVESKTQQQPKKHNETTKKKTAEKNQSEESKSL